MISRGQESSDDEAPEAFSFTSSKKSVQSEAQALQQFHAEEKQKLKEKRRQRDRTLKERKAEAKGKGKGKSATAVVEDESEEDEAEGRKAGGSTDELEARMERAMREAQAESGEDGEGGDFDMEDVDEESEGSESEHESGEEDQDAQMNSDSENEEEENQAIPAKPKRPSAKESQSTQNKDYLPEHLFASAFSHLPTQTDSQTKHKSKKRAASPPTKKRKRVKKASKDVVVGYVNLLPTHTIIHSHITPQISRCPHTPFTRRPTVYDNSTSTRTTRQGKQILESLAEHPREPKRCEGSGVGA